MLYSGDAMRANLLGGFSYTYHLNRTWWIGADFLGGQTKVDRGAGINVRNSKKYIGTDVAGYFNLPAILGEPKNGFRADLYTSLGLGNLWLDRETEFFGFLGGGLLIHLPSSFFAFRFDLKGLFFNLKNSAGENLNADTALSLGPSFIF